MTTSITEREQERRSYLLMMGLDDTGRHERFRQMGKSWRKANRDVIRSTYTDEEYNALSQEQKDKIEQGEVD